jgi:hypothetical protein
MTRSECRTRLVVQLLPLLLAMGGTFLLSLSADAQIEPKRRGVIPPLVGRNLEVNPQAPSVQQCVVEASQITSQKKTTVVQVAWTAPAPLAPPKPIRTKGPRIPPQHLVVQPAQLGPDLSDHLCESLKTGTVTADEVTASLKAMEKENANESRKKRKQIKKAGISYTYEYTLNVDGLKFYQKPDVGYCSDFDWRYKVRNISQREFTVFSTTGEVGVCFSPGFGLFYVPGLATVMPFPVPGLCFDDAAITKLDLRNVNNKFEGMLVELVETAFAELQDYNAKVCVIGSPYPPWFMPVVIPAGQMVVYCTSTRNCEVDAAKLLAAAQGKDGKK